MNLYNETLQIMKRNNISANKNYGQNFLINENVVNSIIDNSNITKEDLVIEIGPGLGTLTNELIKHARKVVAIELDSKMINILRTRFTNEKNLELIHVDFLKFDLLELLQQEIGSIKVVANLPYYITTPIIMKLLEDKLPLKEIVVMVQKEVADRLVSTPGSRLSGAITYAIHYYSKPELLFTVSKDSFIPSPEVESAVIKLTVLDKPSIDVPNEQLFFKIIKQAFSQRRKTLVNALAGFNGLDRTDVLEMFRELHIDFKIRGENLSMNEYKKITEYLAPTQ